MIIRKSLVRMKSMYLMLLKSNTPAWFDHHAHMCVIIQRIKPVDEETYKMSLKIEEKKIPYRIHISLLSFNFFFSNYIKLIPTKLKLVEEQNQYTY